MKNHPVNITQTRWTFHLAMFSALALCSCSSTGDSASSSPTPSQRLYQPDTTQRSLYDGQEFSKTPFSTSRFEKKSYSLENNASPFHEKSALASPASLPDPYRTTPWIGSSRRASRPLARDGQKKYETDTLEHYDATLPKAAVPIPTEGSHPYRTQPSVRPAVRGKAGELQDLSLEEVRRILDKR